MEKILVLVDHNGVLKSTLDFSCYIAEMTKSSLTGLFIDPQKVENKMPQHAYSDEDNELLTETWKTPLAEHKRAFALTCSNKSVRYEDDHDTIDSVYKVIDASRYADLLIINGIATLDLPVSESPSDFVKDILTKAECPVIIAPLSFNGVEEIIFTYDGGPSSMYAIKQFTYLFPEFADTKCSFLQIIPPGDGYDEHHEKIGDYLRDHYSAIGFHTLRGTPENELFSYFLGKENMLIVTGAYGRTAASLFFKKSAAELLLKTTHLPVFIAHR